MKRTVTYDFEFEEGPGWHYELKFDEHHIFIPEQPSTGKQWTKLDFHQCSHCPLKTSEHSDCPVARNLDQVVEDSKNTLSCTRARVRVQVDQREYGKDCDTQEGLRSLFGLVMASSGCPHLDWLRPLARFHLPFSDGDETLFRVFALELLRQYFKNPESSLQSVTEVISQHYAAVIRVNHTFIERIRSYCDEDADKNAIAALDCYAQLFPLHLEARFQELEEIFR